MRLVVTTPLRPSPTEERAAERAAARHGLRYVPRGRGSVAAAVAAAGADGALVLSARAALLALEETVVRWSPGMGALRLKRLLDRRDAGEEDPTTRDPCLDAAGLREGDLVLDCTAGLGADALVAAGAVGATGRVVAVESSPALAAWLAEGLFRFPHEAAGRIEVRAADHAEVLEAAEERSFDVVVFDPMFRHGRAEPSGFDVVRRLSDARPLSAAALARARRVARRWVVVKDGAPGWDLARLGLVPLPSARGAHRYYARVEAG
jgi:hypothetical protein